MPLLRCPVCQNTFRYPNKFHSKECFDCKRNGRGSQLGVPVRRTENRRRPSNRRSQPAGCLLSLAVLLALAIGLAMVI